MKKNIIEINFDKITENDVVVYHDNKWVVISKSIFLNETNKKIKELKKELNDERLCRQEEINHLNEQIIDLKKTIDFLLGEDINEEE